MDWLIQDAWAQGEGQGDPFLSLLPLVLIFAVFYFLLIRPQNKRQKEQKEMVANLSVGDEVVTGGGVLGKITEIKDQFARVQVADGVEIKDLGTVNGQSMPLVRFAPRPRPPSHRRSRPEIAPDPRDSGPGRNNSSHSMSPSRTHPCWSYPA